MSTLTREEWERRFKARIVERLTQPPSSDWTVQQAEEAAQAEWESATFEEHAEFFENDPEGAADEEISNWTD